MPFGGLLTVGIIGAAGGIAGGALGAHAAGQASEAQAQATIEAAKLQKQAADDALAFQKQVFGQSQENIAPWLTSGTVGLQALMQGMGLGTLNKTPGTLVMPTGTPAPTTGTTPTGTTTNTVADPYADQRLQLNQALGQLNLLKQGAALPVTSDPSTLLAGLSAITGQNFTNTNFDPKSIDAGIASIQQQIAALPPPGATGTPASWSVAPGEKDPSLGVGFGEFTHKFGTEDFTADPGYQFRVSEGLKAINQSAAAKGGALSGGAVKAAERYNSGLASQEYQNAFDRFTTEQTNKYNKYASLAGVGQIAANTSNQSGQNFANNASNILMGSAANTGDLMTQAANARASGYIGSANAWGNAIGGVGNNIMNSILLSKLLTPTTSPYQPNPSLTVP